MKTNRPTIILALCTILIGAILISFPANATRWLVTAIGALFLVPGIVSIISYIVHRQRIHSVIAQTQDGTKNSRTSFPFIGIGSTLFGSVLLASPCSFLSALLYLLGAFLVLAGLTQIYRLLLLRKQYKLSAIPYIISSLVSIAGIVVIILNHKTGVPIPNAPTTEPHGELPSLIFGVTSIVYGLTEIVYAIQFRKNKAAVTADLRGSAGSTPDLAHETAVTAALVDLNGRDDRVPIIEAEVINED